MVTLKKLMEIRDLIRSITKTSDYHDEKFVKIKLNSDDQLPLNKMIEIPSMSIVFTAIFLEKTNIIHKLF